MYCKKCGAQIDDDSVFCQIFHGQGKQDERTENNHELKARVKNCIRNCDKAIEAGDKENAQKLLADVQRYMDRALSKGLVKRNTVDRQKSRLSTKVKEMA